MFAIHLIKWQTITGLFLLFGFPTGFVKKLKNDQRLKIRQKAHAQVLYDFLSIVKVAPHECVIRTGQP